MKDYKIAVAGMGYVGLSIATLLSQHYRVMAVDIAPEKATSFKYVEYRNVYHKFSVEFLHGFC